jgi:glycosyltransferase involved in cell wall biosynthesis
MRVAILSPVAWRTPPRRYGPWELVASNITEALVAKGIDVTLFATGDSETKAKLAWCTDQPYAEDPSADVKVNECLHISNLMERAGEFDLIHNHYDFLPLSYSRLINTPILTTIHGFSSPLIVPVYEKYNDDTWYVSISNANRHPGLDYIATVYNGINTREFTFNEHPQDYFLFFGRIHPEKGTLEAIQLSKRCGK